MPPPPPFGWSPSPAPFHYAGADKRNPRPSFARHCEERSDEAIQTLRPDWIASLALAMTTRKGILAARRRPSFAASDDEGTTKIPAHDPEKWRPVFGPRSCATKKGSGAPKGALSNQCPRQARLRALPPPVLPPRKTGEGDHTKCGGGGGAPPFGAHACGTHHRLLPRWLSSRTGFPAAFGANCSGLTTPFALLCPSRRRTKERKRTAVKHAPCGPVLMPVDRGSEAARVRIGNSARGDRASLRCYGMPSGTAPFTERDAT